MWSLAIFFQFWFLYIFYTNVCILFLKEKPSVLRSVTNKSKEKCAHFKTTWKNFNTERSKTVVFKCKKKIRHERREEGNTLEEKSQKSVL